MKLSDLAKRITFTILIIAAICIVSAALYYRSLAFLPFMFGVLIGSATSIAKVLLLERAVDKALAMKQTQAIPYVSIQHIVRLFLTGVVLYLGAVVPHISLWGVAVGILSFQLAIYCAKFTPKGKSD